MIELKLAIVCAVGGYTLLRGDARPAVYFLWVSWLAHLSWFGEFGLLSANNVVGGCAAVALLMRPTPGLTRRLKNPLTWTVLAWTAAVLAGAMRTGRLQMRIDELIPCLAIYFIVALTPWREKDVWTMLWLTVLLGAYQTVIVAAYMGADIWQGASRPEIAGLQYSGFGHRCAAMLPIGWVAARSSGRWRRRLGWGVCALSLAGVLVSKSRGAAVLFAFAVLATVGAGALWRTLGGAKKRWAPAAPRAVRVALRLAAGLAVVGVLAASLWQVLPPRYFVRFGIGRRGEWAARHSVTLRRAYLAVAFKMWQQRPLLGWGDQGFRAEGRDHLPGRLIRRKDIAVHNDYLRTMTNQGMVGLALLGAVLWLAYRNYSAAEARAPAGGGTAVTAVKLYFLVWIASAMLGNGLFETAPFYLLCGLSAALAGTPGRRLCGVARGSRGQARGLASRQAHVARPRGPSESRTVEAL